MKAFFRNWKARCQLAKERRLARALARWRRLNAALFVRAIHDGRHSPAAMLALFDAYDRITRPHRYGLVAAVRRFFHL
jgi:hypothetical protein